MIFSVLFAFIFGNIFLYLLIPILSLPIFVQGLKRCHTCSQMIELLDVVEPYMLLQLERVLGPSLCKFIELFIHTFLPWKQQWEGKENMRNAQWRYLIFKQIWFPFPFPHCIGIKGSSWLSLMMLMKFLGIFLMPPFVAIFEWVVEIIYYLWEC
jgi:hypothetical protein